MSGALKTTSVRIMGDDYPIKSDADADYLHDLAQFVENKISGVGAQNKLPPRLRREILAALLIADDYFTEKRKNEELESRVAELTDKIRTVIDKEFSLGS